MYVGAKLSYVMIKALIYNNNAQLSLIRRCILFAKINVYDLSHVTDLMM